MSIRHAADDSLHHRYLDHGHTFGSSWHPAESQPLSSIDTGDNSAGNGGSGSFLGNLIDASYAAFEPFNIAEAGANATAVAHQTNVVYLDQAAAQIAGIGGNGGNGNAAIGGSAGGFGSTGANLIATGSNSAGNGGDGYFSGNLVHTSVAVYDPINIAVAGYDSTSYANQSNNVQFDQAALQMAGIGGNGGSGNAAVGGAGSLSSIPGLIGSDVIATGGNSAGNGGDGHFAGSMIDLSIAIYAPINIAVAGPNSTADAEQTNNVTFDQSAIQIAGVGGEGGNGNTAWGGDVAMHLLSDLHLLGHA